MKATKSTGVNSLPNRIKFAGCLEIDVNGEYVKDITTPRATAKTIWKAAVKAAKDGIKVDGVNDVAICVHLNGLYIGTVFATKEGRKINLTPDICQSAVNFLVNGIEEDNQATPATPETETAMTTTDNVTTAIANELNARKDKSAWSKAVTAYALELVETLDNWDKQPKSATELREMMLNGASDWNAYSWGGSSLIYNGDIAERCCTPSELKRVTNKNGLRDMANAREYWLDVQARALYQAANLVCNIANNYFNA